MKKMLMVGIVFLLLFLAACSKSEKKELVCDAPYIHHGSECCLDQNSNKVCDNDESASVQSKTSASVSVPLSSVLEKQKVVINGHELTENEIKEFVKIYGKIYPGEFWYDPISGLTGRVGYGTESIIYPGHKFGELRRDASNGNTGVAINGRELTEAEVVLLEKLLRVQRVPGEYYLDAQGNLASTQFGLIGNLYKAPGGGSNSGSNSWSTKTGFSCGSSGGCSYVSIPSANGGVEATVTTSGCG